MLKTFVTTLILLHVVSADRYHGPRYKPARWKTSYGTLYGLKQYKTRRLYISNPNKEPTVCYNGEDLHTDYHTGDSFGYFICPEPDMADDKDLCCDFSYNDDDEDDTQEDMCCSSAERRQHRIIVGAVIGIVVGIIVIPLSITIWIIVGSVIGSVVGIIVIPLSITFWCVFHPKWWNRWNKFRRCEYCRNEDWCVFHPKWRNRWNKFRKCDYCKREDNSVSAMFKADTNKVTLSKQDASSPATIDEGDNWIVGADTATVERQPDEVLQSLPSNSDFPPFDPTVDTVQEDQILPGPPSRHKGREEVLQSANSGDLPPFDPTVDIVQDHQISPSAPPLEECPDSPDHSLPQLNPEAKEATITITTRL